MSTLEINIPDPRKIVFAKPIVKTIVVPAKDGTNGENGKTPTKQELLDMIEPLIPDIPKTISKKEVVKLIEDYIAKIKIEPPTDVTVSEEQE